MKFMMPDIKQQIGTFVQENATALLTAGGVVGTTVTGVLAWRGGYKTGQKVQEHEYEARLRTPAGDSIEQTLSKQDKIKLAALDALPPIVSGGATITAIVMSHRMSAQKAAALAAAYGVSQRHLDEYKAKIQEKLTHQKATSITDEIQQDRVNRHPPSDNVIIVGTGPVLCYDAFSDRYFKSTAENIRRAVNVVNGEIDTGNECSLGVFYNELELPKTQFDDMLGWNINTPCKITISAMMVNDNEACLCVDFINFPIANYGVEY